MSLFACAIQVDGGRVPDSFRASIEASPFARDRALRWHGAHGFLGAVSTNDGGAAPSIVHLGAMVAIGVARLDNRADARRWAGGGEGDESDLALAMRLALHDGGARIADLLGDFAFVAWDPSRRAVVASRDVFGVRKLFHADLAGGVLAFASHASLLGAGDRYDVRYLVERVAQCASDPVRTVHAGVSAVAPATLLTVRDDRRAETRYWSSADVRAVSAPAMRADELVERFRATLIDAVRVRLSDPDTWSQLSGGLDSSSVVSIAQWSAWVGQHPFGLAGTVTYTDRLGTSADERAYSDAVVRMHGVRNEPLPHRLDASAVFVDPPLLDQPNVPFTMALRDRAAGRLVRREGGRVLLTGEGGDSLVAGTMFFFADWLVSGRAREAIGEMAHRAALGRVSFWTLAWENALLPLLPRLPRRALTRRKVGSIPPWVPAVLRRRHALDSRSMLDEVYGGRVGEKYGDALASTIAAIPHSLVRGPFDDLVELRHPYLHRPLVELALRLPAELCVQPHARKWILREAMRGILPEPVRTRIGKGAMDGLNVWSLTHETKYVDDLLRDPILAQLGCIDLPALRAVLGDVRSGRASHDGWRDMINTTLDVEMWLRLRDGRWAAADPQSTCTKNLAMA